MAPLVRHFTRMEKQRRREIVQAYKERKPSLGVFTVTCTATGEVWIGQSRALHTQQNGIWFSLRLGSHRNRALQAAWTAHGEAAFVYAVVEQIDTDDLNAMGRERVLKEREAWWRDNLNARPILG